MSKEGPHGGSSSASSAPVTGNRFDEFLSSRGSDTRRGFTDVLYKSLTKHGVRTFLDEEELSDGECIKKQLPDSIKLSKIGIPILSEDYASSKPCLRELAQMVEWRKEGMIIMPIYFWITAWDVKMKDGKGPYVNKIAAHEQNKVDPATIKDWVAALKEVTSVKGRQLTKYTGQAEFADMMVSKVLKKLRKAQLNLSDKLVGIEDRLPELRRKLDTDSSDVRMIVISGIPGIGKTTLAKSLYNDINHLFDRCSFLADIQETFAKKGLVALQKQLVCDIIRSDLAKFYSVDEGINFLKEKLRSLKVLVLLDDIHEDTQLKSLVGSLDWFGSGSRIIITTKTVLSVCEVAETDDVVNYEVREMEDGDALKLFCRYAFAKDCPEHDYVDLSNDIVSATGKLPLALVLVGSRLSLLRHKRAAWESLREILKSVPYYDNVQTKLKIPYKLLSFFQKQIFLDIACFLIGEDKRIASYMWDECKWNPSFEIKMLCLMSMIKIGDDNKMWMHDQLRKLGSQIVQDDSECKLWTTEAWKIFERDEMQTKVEALCLDTGNTEPNGMDDRSQTCLTADEFKRVPNLRFLNMDHSDIKGDFSGLLSKLLWLRWHGCSRPFKAIKLCLENLVILDLSWSRVTDGWEGWDNIKSRKLKVLILRGCVDLIETPNLSNFKALEILVLEYCSHLVGIHPSIGQLKNLQNLHILDLKFCTDLSNLPRELDSLEALRELHLDGTSIEDIPVSEDMKHLKTLGACSCKSLAQVSSEIGDIKSLEFLSVDGSELSTLPDSIEKLEKLKQLSLRDCRLMWKLPDTIGRLKSLENLDLSSTGIDKLPHAIGDLQILRVLKMDGSFVRKFPRSIGKLQKLEEIHASRCRSLEKIPEEIIGLSRLRILVLSYTNIPDLPGSISSISHLQNLDLYGCNNLHKVPLLPSGLATLRLTYDSSKLGSLDISNLANLKELYLANYLEDDASPGTDGLVVEPLSLFGIGEVTKVETLKLSLRFH